MKDVEIDWFDNRNKKIKEIQEKLESSPVVEYTYKVRTETIEYSFTYANRKYTCLVHLNFVDWCYRMEVNDQIFPQYESVFWHNHEQAVQQKELNEKLSSQEILRSLFE